MPKVWHGAAVTEGVRLPQKAISVFMRQPFMMMRVYPASCYGSMMLKGLVPVIWNWFMFSIIRVSSSARPLI